MFTQHLHVIAPSELAAHVPLVNEIVVCATCDRLWVVLSTDDLGSLDLLPAGGKTPHPPSVETSHCPVCWTQEARDRGATFLRPAPTRLDLRNALREALAGWRSTLDQIGTGHGDAHRTIDLLGSTLLQGKRP